MSRCVQESKRLERGVQMVLTAISISLCLRNGRDRMLGDNAELRQNARAFFGEHGVFVARPVVGIEKLRNAVAHASRPERVQYGEAVF